MTPVTLMEMLEKLVQKEVCALRIPEAGGESKIAVYLMEAPQENLPYVALGFQRGEDCGKGSKSDSVCRVYMQVGVYHESAREGRMWALQIMTKLRTALYREGVIGGCFALREPMEYFIDDDPIPPLFTGELHLVFGMPEIKRETGAHTRKELFI